MDPINEIYFGFRANLPVCGLEFAPIQRLGALARIYREVATNEPFNMPVIYWSFARGFEWLQVDAQSRSFLVDMPAEDSTRGIDLKTADLAQAIEPAIALQKILNCPIPAVFVLHGMADFLGDHRVKALFDRLWDSLVLQEHKNSDGARDFGMVLKRVIVTGDRVSLPGDLSRHIQIYRLPLPGRVDVGLALDAMSKALAASNIPTVLNDDQRRVLVANLAGSPLEQVENTLRKAAKAYGEIGPDAIDLAKGERLRQLQESKAEFIKPPQNAIAGLEVLMEWVRETLVPSINLRLTAKRPDLIPERKGIVLVGPPGTGKTLAAQAITEHLGVPGIKLSMASMMNSGLGDSEQNLLKVFAAARAIAPCVLFVDELDKAGLDNGGDSDGGTTRRMLQAFLEFLNEPKEQTVFVVCAMNRMDKGVPPEFTRPGRFDEIFLVDMPNRIERQAILAVHVAKYRNTLSEEQLAILAEQTQGFSGADLLQVISNTWYAVFNALAKEGAMVEEEQIEISYSAIQALLSGRKMIPSGERFKDEIKKIRELALHAISASRPDPADTQSRDPAGSSPIAGMI